MRCSRRLMRGCLVDTPVAWAGMAEVMAEAVAVVVLDLRLRGPC